MIVPALTSSPFVGVIRAEGGKSGVMYSNLIDEWVECRDEQFGCVSKIDKAGYCTAVDAEGKILKGHEPAHTLMANTRAYIAGGAAHAKLGLKKSK